MPRPVACPVGALLLIGARSKARTDDGRAEARVLTIKEALRLLDLLMKTRPSACAQGLAIPNRGNAARRGIQSGSIPFSDIRHATGRRDSLCPGQSSVSLGLAQSTTGWLCTLLSLTRPKP